MTVKELIEQLSDLDPELYVFVKGYEGGFHYAEILDSELINNFSLNWNPEWYYGPHELTENLPKEFRSRYEQVKGIVL